MVVNMPYGTLRDIANELKNIREILEKQSTTEQSLKVGECPYFIDGVWCNLVGKEMKGVNNEAD